MKTYKKHKLGLALGSGGARGMALLGALKALEEENIELSARCMPKVIRWETC